MRAEHTTDRIDIELPLQEPRAVDVDLGSAETPVRARSASTMLQDAQPTLSQLAGRASAARVRWPGRSRSGYHGGTCWNWMRDGTAGFGDYRIGDR